MNRECNSRVSSKNSERLFTNLKNTTGDYFFCRTLCWGKCWGSYDVTSVLWLILWQLCVSRRPGSLFETRCLQCCCPRGKSLSSRILEDQFSSPRSCLCPHPWVSSPWQQHWYYTLSCYHMPTLPSPMSPLSSCTGFNVCLGSGLKHTE